MRILACDLGSTSRRATKTYASLLDTNTGEVERTKCPTAPDDLIALIRGFRPERVVIEQTCGTGWVVDLCRGCEVEVQVVNPRDEAWKNRSSKTDRQDADLLAKLSATGQVRTVHVPAREIREWRCLIDYRHRLVGRRTRIKNRIRALLREAGLQIPRLWSTDGMGRLSELARPFASCPVTELWKCALGCELRQYAEMKEHLSDITSALDRLVEASAPACELLKEHGIGPRAAEVVVATLADPLRFTNRKQIGSYIGVVPRVSQSGGSRRHGGITKAGDHLARAILTEVVQLGRGRPGWIQTVYRQHRRDDPQRDKIAIQATVRRLVVRLWAKLRDHRRAHPDLPLLTDPSITPTPPPTPLPAAA